MRGPVTPTAVVTGGLSGIGAGISRRLATGGLRVVATHTGHRPVTGEMLAAAGGDTGDVVPVVARFDDGSRISMTDDGMRRCAEALSSAPAFDLGFLLDQASRHRLLALVARNMAEHQMFFGKPETRLMHSDVFLSNLLLHRQRHTVLRPLHAEVIFALRQAGVVAAVRKGGYLAEHVYPEPGALQRNGLSTSPFGHPPILILRATTDRESLCPGSGSASWLPSGGQTALLVPRPATIAGEPGGHRWRPPAPTHRAGPPRVPEARVMAGLSVADRRFWEAGQNRTDPANTTVALPRRSRQARVLFVRLDHGATGGKDDRGAEI